MKNMIKKEDIEIVYYSDEYEKAHFEFATRNYGKRRKRRNKDYLYWKFRGEEGTELKTLVLAYDFKEGKVVGQIGLIPFKVELDNKIYKTAWRCDVMLEQEYRGIGVAQMMYEKTHENYNLLFNCGSSISAKKAILKMGYKPIKRSFSLTMPIKYDFFNQKLNFKKPNLSNVRNFLFKVNSKLFKSVDFSEISLKEYLANSSNIVSNKYIKSQKTTDFVNWRFSKFKDYYEGIKCYKSSSDVKFSGYYTKANIFFITEICSFSFRDTISVLKYVYKKFKDKGLKEVQFTYHFKNKLPFFFALGCYTFNFKPQNMFYTTNKNLEHLIDSKEFLFNNFDCDKNL